jgi:hypothetical protein
MGYEFDFDEEFDTAAFKSIDELLTEGSLARKGSITEESISDNKFERKLSTAESNESDIYSEGSVELEDSTVSSVVTDTTPSEELKTETGSSVTEQLITNEVPEPLLSPVDQTPLNVNFSFPPVQSYNLFDEKQIRFINKIKKVMFQKFPTYNDFTNCINNYQPEYLMDSRCFLFYHLIYMFEHPIDFIYMLDFDPFNSSPLVSSPCLEIMDFWKYINKL